MSPSGIKAQKEILLKSSLLYTHSMKVALVYDRVNKWGGAERVLMTLHKIFPDAPLYTSVYSRETAKWADIFPKVYTTFLQKFPIMRKNHQYLGTIMPFAFEQFNFDKYDVVISVTSESSKAIITGISTKHICYCLTPTRYLWSGYNSYFSNNILRFFSWPFVLYLRYLDRQLAQRPDQMIAISSVVQKRISKYYGRKSLIVFPPVEKIFTKRKLDRQIKKQYFLLVSRLVPYKRVDLAILAFNRLGLMLVVVGSGSQEKYLKSIANENIIFVGQASESMLSSYYSYCKAVVFPQEEDFGLVAVEAQLYGKPVVAYKRGGAIDTIIENKTGVFFGEQTVGSLVDCVRKFERMHFDRSTIVRNARRFSVARFKKELLALVKS